MKNPASIIPEALPALLALNKAADSGGVPAGILALVHLRASQINGCSACVFAGSRSATEEGVTADQLSAVSAWREAPFFNEAERAALSLTEAATRIADSSDPVPDEVWDEASQHFDSRGLASLVLKIATTNAFNRLNLTTKQIAGAWG